MLLVGHVTTLMAPPFGPWWKAQLDGGETIYLRREAVDFMRQVNERFGEVDLLFVAEPSGLRKGQVLWLGTNEMFDDAIAKGILPESARAWRFIAMSQRSSPK